MLAVTISLFSKMSVSAAPSKNGSPSKEFIDYKYGELSDYLNYTFCHFSMCAFQFPCIGNPICYSFQNS